MAVEQGQLVDQHRSKSESGRVDESSGGNLSVHFEDGLEMLVEVLISHAAQLVEDAPDLDAIIGVRVSPSFGDVTKNRSSSSSSSSWVLRRHACLTLGAL